MEVHEAADAPMPQQQSAASISPPSTAPAPARPLVPRHLLHPDEFHAGGWDSKGHMPVVGGQYEDRTTGELRPGCGTTTAGPPSVDIVIFNLNPSSAGQVVRASRPLPLRTLLCHVMKVVERRGLGIDSVVATAYSLRVVLLHEFAGGREESSEAVREMVHGFRPGYGEFTTAV